MRLGEGYIGLGPCDATAGICGLNGWIGEGACNTSNEFARNVLCAAGRADVKRE